MDILMPLLRVNGDYLPVSVILLSVCAALGYLLGNMQSGVFVGRLMGKGDLRFMGSRASGATNAWRVLGKKAAAFTFLGDFAKGLLAAWIGTLIGGREGGLLAGIFVIVGHIWPAFFGWRGGKGVASALGVLALLQPAYALVYATVLLAAIGIKRIVSLGSVSGAFVILIANAIWSISQHDWLLLAFGLLVNGMILFAHRSNIQRLIHGKEALVHGLPWEKDWRS